MARTHTKETDEHDLFPNTEWSWEHHVGNAFIKEFYQMRHKIAKLETEVSNLKNEKTNGRK